MKKLLFLVIVLLVAVLMTQMRPSKAEHKAAMMKAVKELVDEEAENKGLKDNGLTRFGKNVVNKAIEVALGSKLRLNDYYLFNTTHVRLKGEDKLLSVGMFGHVFTFDKKMLRDALEEGDDSPTKRRLPSRLRRNDRRPRNVSSAARSVPSVRSSVARNARQRRS